MEHTEHTFVHKICGFGLPIKEVGTLLYVIHKFMSEY